MAAEYGARGIRRYLKALRDEAPSMSDTARLAFGVPADDFNAAFRWYVRVRFVDGY
jgi:hypothetical protein